MADKIPQLSSNRETIQNAELVDFDPKKYQSLSNWTIPKVRPNKIYEVGTFDFKSRMVIKTVEQTLTLNQQDVCLNLLLAKDINRYRKDYKFIHIGSVQIAFKPLSLLGCNTCFQAIARDARNNDFIPSLMGFMESSVCYGPVYTDIYPNLSLSFTDPNILDGVNLRILTKGYNYKYNSEPLALQYRIYFKVMNTLSPNVRKISKHGETVLIETNLLTTSVATPKQIKWNEIDFPDTWVIPSAIPPKPQTCYDIRDVVEINNGDVMISFDRIKRTQSLRDYKVSLPSTSRPSTSRRSTSSMKDENLEFEGIRLSDNQIPHGIYRREENRTSPTASEINNFAL